MSAESSRDNLSGHRNPPPSPASYSGSTDALLANSDGNGNNAGIKTTPAWNKPSSDVVVAIPVAGNDDSWPALSESTKHTSKSTVDSPKRVSDASVSSTQGHLISNSRQNQNKNYSNTNQNHKFTANHSTMSVRQRSSKRGGVGGGSSQSGFSHPPPPPPLPPPFPIYELPYGALPPPMPGPFFLGHSYYGNNLEIRPAGGFSPQSTSVNDQPFQRSSYPRSNYGSRPRGDGPFNNTHGSRREQHSDRNTSRRGFARTSPPPPPPPPPAFFQAPSMRLFPDAMGYDMQYGNLPTLPPEFFMRFPQPAPTFFPAADPSLPSELVKQIDHYFSDDNLAKDSFLRSKMDDEGWVDIALIASFRLVQKLTKDLQLILNSLRASAVVEVQGNRIRRRNEWRKWILPFSRGSTSSGSLTPVGSAENVLANSFQNVTLEDETSSNSGVVHDGKADSSTNVVQCRSVSEEMAGHAYVAT